MDAREQRMANLARWPQGYCPALEWQHETGRDFSYLEQCRALTAKRRRCRYPAKAGHVYCGYHRPKRKRRPSRASALNQRLTMYASKEARWVPGDLQVTRAWRICLEISDSAGTRLRARLVRAWSALQSGDAAPWRATLQSLRSECGRA